MARKGLPPFVGTIAGLSTLKPLGENEGAGMFVKITVKVPAAKVDLNALAQFQQRGEELDVTMVPTPAALPGVE